MPNHNQNDESRQKSISRSKRAGLTYPVGRIHRYLKHENHDKRVSINAAVYLAGILEYITSEILDLSTQEAQKNGRLRIKPRHIQLAIHSDQELSRLMRGCSIAGGGVLPHIPCPLLPIRRR